MRAPEQDYVDKLLKMIFPKISPSSKARLLSGTYPWD